MKTIGILKPTPPYNFDLTLDLLSRYAHPTVDIVHEGAYWRALHSEDGLILCRVTSEGSPQTPQLRVDALTPPAHGTESILAKIERILSLKNDPTPFYAYAMQDAQLWEIVQPLVGLRWVTAETVFEALMTTIIEQQISWVAAQKAQRWLVEWAGHRITHHRDYYAFPTPEQIAHATVDDLKPLKITFKRMAVMIDIAQKVVEGTLDLESLRDLPAEALYNALLTIKGIGHWTATWTLQRTQGQQNYVGANDVALQAAVNHYFYGKAGKLPQAEVEAVFARYGDYAGLAANYTIVRWVLDHYGV